MNPIRIQRKRVKGWKKPEGCINVSRPSKYSNPYKLSGDMIYGYAGHRRTILNPWIFIEVVGAITANERLIKLFEDWVNGSEEHDIITCPYTIEDIKRELKGRNLMCFCKEGEICHADVLLKIANG